MTADRPFASYRSTNTWTNALLGGVISVLVAFVPFSPLVGGFVAGYLHDADRSAALRVGAYAGLVALAPAVLLGGLFLLVGVVGFLGYGAPNATIVLLLVVLLGGTIAVLYTVGLSAVGGYLGAIVAEDYA